jgi:hypothetical protein
MPEIKDDDDNPADTPKDKPADTPAPSDAGDMRAPERGLQATDTEDAVRPPPDKDRADMEQPALRDRPNTPQQHDGVRPPSYDITHDPYYTEPLGPNDREAERANNELQAIRDHPGGSRQALAEAMGWHGPDDQAAAQDHPHEQASPGDAHEHAAIAHEIAHGHAFEKHKSEFSGIETEEDLESITRDIMERNPAKELDDQRRAYWDDDHQAVVVVDPNHRDQGTIFKPRTGKKYYDGL